MKQVTCEICGKQFSAKKKGKYCPECSHERALERGRVWRKKPTGTDALSSIAEIALAARSAGMTYGQFVAWAEKK